MELLYRTIHGSYLYGLATTESDIDFFEVYDKLPGLRRKAQHKVKNGMDITKMPLSLWLHYCDEGAHQSLEAMFSRKAEWDSPITREIRRNYWPDTAKVAGRYEKTIEAFQFPPRTFKRYRHSLRLGMNLTTLLEHGSFNPTLTADEVVYLNERAEREWQL